MVDVQVPPSVEPFESVQMTQPSDLCQLRAGTSYAAHGKQTGAKSTGSPPTLSRHLSLERHFESSGNDTFMAGPVDGPFQASTTVRPWSSELSGRGPPEVATTMSSIRTPKRPDK